MENGSFCQCCLASASFALENLDPLASPVSAVLVATTLGANKSLRPASRFKYRLTLLLFPILSKKLVQAQTRLKLYADVCGRADGTLVLTCGRDVRTGRWY